MQSQWATPHPGGAMEREIQPEELFGGGPRMAWRSMAHGNRAPGGGLITAYMDATDNGVHERPLHDAGTHGPRHGPLRVPPSLMAPGSCWLDRAQVGEGSGGP